MNKTSEHVEEHVEALVSKGNLSESLMNTASALLNLFSDLQQLQMFKRDVSHIFSYLSFIPESRHLRSSGSLLGDQPEITITQHHSSSDSSSLAPLVEQEGEAYLEKVGGVRRHTVANAHSDVRLLSVSGRMHAGIEKDHGMREGENRVEFLVGGRQMSPRTFSSQPDMVECPRGGVICLPNT